MGQDCEWVSRNWVTSGGGQQEVVRECEGVSKKWHMIVRVSLEVAE